MANSYLNTQVLSGFIGTNKSRHLGYSIQQEGRTIQFPYLHYGVYDGIPYKLGTEGAGQPLFVHKMYTQAHALLEVLGVDNKELDLFIRNVPFNFTLKQALASLEDLGMLAEVARLQAIIA